MDISEQGKGVIVVEAVYGFVRILLTGTSGRELSGGLYREVVD